MFKIFYSFIFFIYFVLNGCYQKKERESYINHSLISATQIIENYTTQEYDDLKRKMFDPTTSERAKSWYPISEKIKSLTSKVRQNSDSLFQLCDDSNIEECKSYLLKVANSYKNSVLLVHPDLKQDFTTEFSKLLDSTYFEKFKSKNEKNDLHDIFYNTISIIENKAISFCNLQASPGCILQYERFTVLIGQNSKHFKSGDKIEITAGVGSYSRASNPKITIDNKLLKINDIGYADFKKDIIGSSGKYVIPIIISYYSPEGILKTTKQEVEYFIDQ